MKSKSPTEKIKPESEQRLDSWLWASRFFKTRQLSAKAVVAGHVRVNGVKSKPGKIVRPGTDLIIKKNHLEFNIKILATSPRRLSAPQSLLLYEEPEWSIKNREAHMQMRKNSLLGVRYDVKKPDKRTRQKMMKIKYSTNQES